VYKRRTGRMSVKINDILCLRQENSRLKNELQFAQNFNELLQNYRHLMTTCVTTCDNCNKNEDILQKYHYLEVTYNKHLDFAKEKELNSLNTTTAGSADGDSGGQSGANTTPTDPLLDGCFGDDSDDDSDDEEDGEDMEDSDDDEDDSDSYIDPIDYLLIQQKPPARRGRPPGQRTGATTRAVRQKRNTKSIVTIDCIDGQYLSLIMDSTLREL
jgi:hypothetical protein